MIYLFAANEYALIEKALKKTINSLLPERNAFNLVRYDMREIALADVVDDASMISFDNESRVFVLDFSTFLSTSTEKTINKDIDDNVINQLGKVGEEVHIIFISRSSKVNTKHKIYKLIENNGTINIEKDIDKNDWQKFVYAYFDRNNISIDRNAALELINRVNNLGSFLQEAEKLAIYGEKITLPIVQELVTPLLEENSYELVNAFISGNKTKTLKIWQDFRVQNQEPVAFIAQVGNQFRAYAQIYILHESGLTNTEIAANLKIHEYRVKLAMEQRRKTSLEQVFEILLALSKLDYEIKSGQTDRFYGFELFLLNY